MPTPTPANEDDRLAALRRLQILDTLPQKAFDSITALAAGICGTPMALISLVDSNRQWFKSRQGVELTQTSRSEAFCAHAIMEPSEVLVVNDATHDERFQDFPMVRRGELVFYAGAPIVTSSGAALGTVCVLDQGPRPWRDDDLASLRDVASAAAALIEGELKGQRARRMEARVRTASQAGSSP